MKINLFGFLILTLTGIALFTAGLQFGVYARSGTLQTVDLSIARFFNQNQFKSLILFSQIVSSFEVILTLGMIGLFIIFIRRKDKKSAFTVSLAAIAWLVMKLLKIYFDKPCPSYYGIQELYWLKFLSGGFLDHIGKSIFPQVCYPSGHTANYVVTLGILIFLQDKLSSNKYIRKALQTTFIFLIASVGVSRIILGSHFLSDVLGGYLFGLGNLLIILSVSQIY